jgi:hypothetical protein
MRLAPRKNTACLKHNKLHIKQIYNKIKKRTIFKGEKPVDFIL